MRSLRACGWLAAACAALLALPGTARAQILYSGEAFGLELTTPIVPLTVFVNDTGPLPSSGGTVTSNLLSEALSTPQLSLTTGVESAFATGSGGSASSSSSVNNLAINLTAPGVLAAITAESVTANAGANGIGVSGSSIITGLSINGIPVVVTGNPNQSVVIPGFGSLIINEQIDTSSGGHHEMTVNALDFSVFGGSLIVSHANSDIDGAGGASVPEPGSLTLLGSLGLASFGFLRRRNRR